MLLCSPHKTILLTEWMVFTFILLSFCFQFHVMRYFNCFRFFFLGGGAVVWGCGLVNYVYQSVVLSCHPAGSVIMDF